MYFFSPQIPVLGHYFLKVPYSAHLHIYISFNPVEQSCVINCPKSLCVVSQSFTKWFQSHLSQSRKKRCAV